MCGINAKGESLTRCDLPYFSLGKIVMERDKFVGNPLYGGKIATPRVFFWGGGRKKKKCKIMTAFKSWSNVIIQI